MQGSWSAPTLKLGDTLRPSSGADRKSIYAGTTRPAAEKFSSSLPSRESPWERTCAVVKFPPVKPETMTPGRAGMDPGGVTFQRIYGGDCSLNPDYGAGPNSVRCNGTGVDFAGPSYWTSGFGAGGGRYGKSLRDNYSLAWLNGRPKVSMMSKDGRARRLERSDAKFDCAGRTLKNGGMKPWEPSNNLSW